MSDRCRLSLLEFVELQYEFFVPGYNAVPTTVSILNSQTNPNAIDRVLTLNADTVPKGIAIIDGGFVIASRSSPYLRKYSVNGDFVASAVAIDSRGLAGNGGSTFFSIDDTAQGHVLREYDASLSAIRTLATVSANPFPEMIYATSTKLWVLYGDANCSLSYYDLATGAKGPTTALRLLDTLVGSSYYGSALAVSDDGVYAVVPSYDKLAIYHLPSSSLYTYVPNMTGGQLASSRGNCIGIRGTKLVGITGLGRLVRMDIEEDSTLSMVVSSVSGSSASYYPAAIRPI